ncbi:MAG: PEP/pyruvate-binding domain-containing protein, partial [Pseudomonadota bacterium]|nr:PEP/pyruvate-binding domain-containing protein [Pseudomonadota bacterium]
MKPLLTCVAVTSLLLFHSAESAASSSEKLLPEQLPIELGAGYIPDRETFLTLAHIGAERGSNASKDVELMKFVVEVRPDQPMLVYWMNTNNYQKHPNFMNEVGIDFSFGGDGGRSGGKGGNKEGRAKGSDSQRRGKDAGESRGKSAESMGPIERGERGSEITVSRNVGKKISVIDHYEPSSTSVVLRADMSYLADVEAPDGSLGIYTFNLEPSVPIELLSKVYQAILASFPAADGKLAYRVSKKVFNNQRSQYLDAGVHVYSDVEMYTSLNEAVSFGKLVFLSEQEQPNPNDIVIAQTLPNTMPRVAGVITSIRQTPLSHVNLRAVQDNVPNSYIANVLTSKTILALIGQYVRYEVTSEGYSLRAASLDEVTDYFTSRLSKKEVELQPDLSRTEILPLDSLSFNDAKSIGVKAANLAELRRVGLPDGTIPDGFAVPFCFYDAFMRFNGFYADVDALMADEALKKDPERLQKALTVFQKRIKRATFPEELMNKLAEVQASFPAGQSMRTRSSTNNEDLEGFSGAGLYDS